MFGGNRLARRLHEAAGWTTYRLYNEGVVGVGVGVGITGIPNDRQVLVLRGLLFNEDGFYSINTNLDIPLQRY